MSKKVYIHKDTGDVRVVRNRAEARKLPPGFGVAEFMKNDKGEPGMRFELNGATVFISENEIPEVAKNGNTATK